MIINILCTIWDFLKNNWSPVLATLAFIVSFLTLYYTHWSHFDPHIYSAGRYSFRINPKNYLQMMIAPSLIFANEGIRNGLIENIWLVIETHENSTLVLIPQFVINSKNINQTDPSKAPPLESEVFTKFHLAGKEMTIKEIAFISQSKEKFMLSSGDHRAEIFAKTSASKEIKKFATLTIQVDESDIVEITKGIPATIKPGEGVSVISYSRIKVTPEFDAETKDLEKYLSGK